MSTSPLCDLLLLSHSALKQQEESSNKKISLLESINKEKDNRIAHLEKQLLLLQQKDVRLCLVDLFINFSSFRL